MRGDTSIEDVIDALEHRGFKLEKRDSSGNFKLIGKVCLTKPNDDCRCELSIDPNFIELPRIRLLDIPPDLPDCLPHIGTNGSVCYVADGTVVVDIFDPVGQTLACIERATTIIDSILQGELVDDMAEEFFAYWNGQICMTDIEGNGLGEQYCIVAESNDKPLLFITDDKERTELKIRSIGYKKTNDTLLTYRIKTTAQPRPRQTDWPPRTVGDILTWQSTLDKNCRRKITQRLEEGRKKKVLGVLILIESPLMTYGFFVKYGHAAKSISLLEVFLVHVLRIDDQYLAQRNIPGLSTLGGKNIAIVGCGTIGGYLSDMLVKAGAGSSGGRLTLVDREFLLPQNIGRHRLGFSDLFSNKADGLKKELIRSAPSVEIRALPVDIKQAELGSIDILIDATGEEALGHWLCRKYLPDNQMLSIWIEGPGTAVRALIKTSSNHACYRCLWHSHKRGELLPTDSPIPIIMEGEGCEEIYVPFPASVSIQAASLATEMVLDWANAIYSPALRSRITDQSYSKETSDCDPQCDRDCPICIS